MTSSAQDIHLNSSPLPNPPLTTRHLLNPSRGVVPLDASQQQSSPVLLSISPETRP